jgi:hypothetical protein
MSDLTLPDFLNRLKDKHKPKHARLAPSAAHRWIECPGSVRMSEGIEAKSSVYANEGTAAHALAALCLRDGRDAEHYAGQIINTEGTLFMPESPLGDNNDRFIIDEEMVEGVQIYLDHVRKFSADGAEIDVEQRLDLTHVHEQCFGTGDAVVYQPAAEHLHVFDLKYGKGVAVEVDGNPQLLTYGSGAVRRYHNRPLKNVTLHVVQPRVPHKDGPVRSKDYDILDLLEFESSLAKAALATERVDAPLRAGEWCRFCPALAICSAAREKAARLALKEFASVDGDPMDPHMLEGEALAKVLTEADYILSWVKAVQEYAHAEAVAGRCPPGFKLVAKRATRKWKGDESEIKGVLAIDYDLADEDMLTEPKLKSPAQIEKVVGKKAFAEIEAKLVEKVSAGTNLVPVHDPRPAVKTEGVSDFV